MANNEIKKEIENVYRRYKHLDALLSKAGSINFNGYILQDLWRVIKKWGKDREAEDEKD